MIDENSTNLPHQQEKNTTPGIQSAPFPVKQPAPDINDLLNPNQKSKTEFSKFKFKVITIFILFFVMLGIFVSLSIVSQKTATQNPPPLPVDIQSPSPAPQEASPESKIIQEINKFKNLTDAINSNSDKLTPPKIDLTITLK